MSMPILPSSTKSSRRMACERRIDKACRRSAFASSAMTPGLMTDHSVTAASSWGADAERRRVRPALGGTYGATLHEVAARRFWLDTADRAGRDTRRVSRLERAIGVIYRPETEHQSHYFDARLGDQFDAVIHLDRTPALEPLERTSTWDRGEPPETFPTGV